MLVIDRDFFSDLARALQSELEAAGIETSYSHAYGAAAGALGFLNANSVSAILGRGPVLAGGHPGECLAMRDLYPSPLAAAESFLRLVRHEAACGRRMKGAELPSRAFFPSRGDIGKANVYVAPRMTVGDAMAWTAAALRGTGASAVLERAPLWMGTDIGYLDVGQQAELSMPEDVRFERVGGDHYMDIAPAEGLPPDGDVMFVLQPGPVPGDMFGCGLDIGISGARLSRRLLAAAEASGRTFGEEAAGQAFLRALRSAAGRIRATEQEIALLDAFDGWGVWVSREWPPMAEGGCHGGSLLLDGFTSDVRRAYSPTLDIGASVLVTLALQPPAPALSGLEGGLPVRVAGVAAMCAGRLWLRDMEKAVGSHRGDKAEGAPVMPFNVISVASVRDERGAEAILDLAVRNAPRISAPARLDEPLGAAAGKAFLRDITRLAHPVRTSRAWPPHRDPALAAAAAGGATPRRLLIDALAGIAAMPKPGKTGYWQAVALEVGNVTRVWCFPLQCNPWIELSNRGIVAEINYGDPVREDAEPWKDAELDIPPDPSPAKPAWARRAPRGGPRGAPSL